MRIRFFVGALLVALGMAGCSDNQAPSQSIIGAWRLQSFGTVGHETNVLSTTSIMIEFNSDGSVSGNGGVNSYGGSYTAGAGGSFSVGQLVMTEMASIDPSVNEQESAYMLALTGANRWSVDSGNLVLWYDYGNSRMTYVR